MNLLSDVITYIRRIIKSPSDAVISDSLIIDYINRFWLMDVDARMQLFDLKTSYRFQTTPGVTKYNMPLYDAQSSSLQAEIAPFPVYQGFMSPCTVNGIFTPLMTRREEFLKWWPNYTQPLIQAATGDGGSNYDITLPFFPAVPGHVDMAGIIATGTNEDPPVVPSFNASIPSTSVYSAVYFTTQDATGANAIVADSGQFLDSNVNYGLLMRPGKAPFGNVALNGGYSTTLNSVNYQTGQANVTFTAADGSALSIPVGNPIQAQCSFFQQGIPRSILFYNNTIEMLPPPNTQYIVELEAYLTPAAFLATGQSLPFAYMAEYLARGAARKILADTGDTEQFAFYEPLFREQEMLVWKRSQRQFTATRTPTIFSQGSSCQPYQYNSIGLT